MTELLTSPLNAKHEELGATFTAFGPWNMPLKYNSELEEHRAVRNSAGLFDLSHMGEIWVNGPVAIALLDTSAELEPGTAVEVEIRGKRYPFEVTALPFYKRDK